MIREAEKRKRGEEEEEKKIESKRQLMI